MATVDRNSNAANLTTAGDVAPQVEERIASVNSAYSKALDALSGSMIIGQTEAEENATGVVRGFRDDIDSWSARGRDSLKKGTSPGGSGWKGWVNAGNAYIDGLKVQANFKHEALRDIIEIVKEAPATSAKATKKAAKAAMEVAGNVATAAGTEIGRGLLMPLGVALGSYLLIKVITR